jgi:chromosome segregation ATPase
MKWPWVSRKTAEQAEEYWRNEAEERIAKLNKADIERHELNATLNKANSERDELKAKLAQADKDFQECRNFMDEARRERDSLATQIANLRAAQQPAFKPRRITWSGPGGVRSRFEAEYAEPKSESARIEAAVNEWTE